MCDKERLAFCTRVQNAGRNAAHCSILHARINKSQQTGIGKMASPEITVPELAKRLGCSIPYAQALIRKGKIRGRKGARGWVATTVAVEAYLEKRAAQGSGKKR
jgi:excisionase family DNA binding protein